MKKSMLKVNFILLLSLLSLLPLSKVFNRKSDFLPFENRFRISGMYDLPNNIIDVGIVGSSHAYTSINPKQMYEKHNIIAYNFSSQQQSIPISYYYIKELLSNQSPKIILLNTYMFNKNIAYDEGIMRDAIEYLPLSKNKIQMIFDLVPRDEQLSYFVPFLKYHNRWNDITIEEVKASFKKRKPSALGFVSLESKQVKDISEAPALIEEGILNNYFDENDLKYFFKIVELARGNGVELILYDAPYHFDENSYYQSLALEKIASDLGLEYINYKDIFDFVGFDYDEDFYDNSHLNYRGAEKLTEDISVRLKTLYLKQTQLVENKEFEKFIK